MTEKHFWGGYYLVEGSSRKSWFNNSLIPRLFYSLSNCICPRYPDISTLTWVNDTEEKEKQRTKLGLTVKEFQLQKK